MHDTRRLTEDRITRMLRERLLPAVHRTVGTVDIAAWHVDGGRGEPVAVGTALAASYAPFAVGDRWGPAWGTSWFRLTGRIPPEAAGRTVELVVDLGWGGIGPGFTAEGLLHTADGTPVKGIHPFNAWAPLPDGPGAPIELYLEAAANPVILGVGVGRHPFAATPLGEKATAGADPLYRLVRADICVREGPDADAG